MWIFSIKHTKSQIEFYICRYQNYSQFPFNLLENLNNQSNHKPSNSAESRHSPFSSLLEPSPLVSECDDVTTHTSSNNHNHSAHIHAYCSHSPTCPCDIVEVEWIQNHNWRFRHWMCRCTHTPLLSSVFTIHNNTFSYSHSFLSCKCSAHILHCRHPTVPSITVHTMQTTKS